MRHRSGEESEPGVGRLPAHAPQWIWAGAAVFALVWLSYVGLIVLGRPTQELTQILDWTIRAVTGAAALGGAGLAWSGARSSRTAADRLNGGLERRLETAATRAVRTVMAEDPPGQAESSARRPRYRDDAG